MHGQGRKNAKSEHTARMGKMDLVCDGLTDCPSGADESLFEINILKQLGKKSFVTLD